MSAAAKHLYLSQPTVSQAIREMEQHYHGLLFERFRKKLYLTERGKLLLSHARDLVSRFEQLDGVDAQSGTERTISAWNNADSGNMPCTGIDWRIRTESDGA